jgi:glutamate 5-kinase
MMLGSARRVVVKVGSALLVDAATGEAATAWLAALASDCAAIRARGGDVVVVSSGAVAMGRRVLGLGAGKLALEEKQAAAAAGQARLLAAWGEAFAPHGAAVAQALLTPDDTERRRRWLNARATLETLLSLKAVPVINENDTVATQELRYGDNDRLAARVAQMVGADALVLLSDVDGLYTADPRKDPAARHIAVVEAIDQTVEAMAGGANADAGVGSGGMRTKIEAAKIATAAGCAVAITDGRVLHPLARLADGASATWFRARGTPQSARLAWLAHTLKPAGAVTVDAGAASALARGASLLPVGVTAVSGAFERGDAVLILGPDGATLARGLSAYDAADAARIKGRRSEEVEAILGFAGRPALVHRDDMVLAAQAIAAEA